MKKIDLPFSLRKNLENIDTGSPVKEENGPCRTVLLFYALLFNGWV